MSRKIKNNMTDPDVYTVIVSVNRAEQYAYEKNIDEAIANATNMGYSAVPVHIIPLEGDLLLFVFRIDPNFQACQNEYERRDERILCPCREQHE
jgi:hypothetical protein